LLAASVERVTAVVNVVSSSAGSVDVGADFSEIAVAEVPRGASAVAVEDTEDSAAELSSCLPLRASPPTVVASSTKSRRRPTNRKW
jgi:hypothetical protein